MVVLECVKICCHKIYLIMILKNYGTIIEKNDLYFIDHHQSHATYAFLNSGYKQSDILAIDGNRF